MPIAAAHKPVSARRPPAVWVMVSICLGAAVALGAAESGREFAHLEIAADAGARRFAARATGLRDDGLVLRFTDGLAELALFLPDEAAAGTRLSGRAVLHEAGVRHEGVATLDVDETGEFVAGRLTASLGAVTVAGGLRVRVTSPAPGLVVSLP